MKCAGVVLALTAVFLSPHVEAHRRGPGGPRHSFQTHFRIKQNFYRSKHGAPLIKEDPVMSRIAQMEAKFYAEINSKITHPLIIMDGIYIFTTTKHYPVPQYNMDPLLAQDVAETWYNGSRYYNYSTGYLASSPPLQVFAPFTQMVWKSTRFFGVGQATSRRYRTYVVAYYDPPGNILDAFMYNVNPPRGLTKEVNLQNMLEKEQNNHRWYHGVPLIKGDRRISRIAQMRADLYANSNTSRGVNNLKDGIYVFKTSKKYSRMDLLAKDIVRTWYKASKKYIYNRDPSLVSGPPQLYSEHFTQMVWKETKSFGVGKAFSRGGMTYVVVYYDPPGNVKGRFLQNVLTPH